MKRGIIISIFGSICIAAGIAVLVSMNSAQTAVVAPPTQTQIETAQAELKSQLPANTVSGVPVSLSIPSLNMNVAIAPGTYDQTTQSWTLSDKTAQYAVMTAPANTASGNTFIYGHARKGIFGTLHNIGTDAEAYVTADNGATFVYKLSKVSVVSPEESSSVFDYQGPSIMTVQTCTGLFSEKRQLFTFSFERLA